MFSTSSMPVLEHEYRKMFSIPISIWLVWPLRLDTNIVRLLLCEICDFGTNGTQVKPCHLFIECLWQQVNFVLILLLVFPIVKEIQLGKRLICERARHDKGWMPSCTSKVEQAATCK